MEGLWSKQPHRALFASKKKAVLLPVVTFYQKNWLFVIQSEADLGFFFANRAVKIQQQQKVYFTNRQGGSVTGNDK